MTTIEQLIDEIRALQIKVDEFETQLTNLLNEGIEGTIAEQKQLMIKYFGDRISDINNQILVKDKLIAAKEIEKDKQITAEKEKEAEKEKQITADKQYRLERGETTTSPITLYLFLFIKLSSVSCLHPSSS